MKTIWKRELEIADQQFIDMPDESEILCVQIQQEIPCIWFRCDPDNELVRVTINTYGTGHTVESAKDDYVGTYQLHDGNLVFHVFAE